MRSRRRGVVPHLACAVQQSIAGWRWLRTRRKTGHRRAYFLSAMLIGGHRQRDAVHQDHGVDLNATRILVSGANLITVLRDEVVIVRYEQEEIIWVFRIERRHERHAFPFFREIVAIVRRTIV